MSETKMNGSSENYGDNSISSLKGEDRVRLRPEAILGSSGINGARHTVIEILGNSLDEATSGYGKRIEVKRYLDGSISIRDYGRGVPLGWNEKEQRWNWDLVYSELYAGGKYDDSQDKLSKIDWDTVTWDKLVSAINYVFSIGLNGLGGAATQYSSRYFTVKSVTNGVCREMQFERGRAIWKELKEYPTDEKDGTFIHWKPDDGVFTDTNIDAKWLVDTCGDTLQVAGVEFYFEDEESGQEMTIPGDGLIGIFERKVGHDLVKETNNRDELKDALYECSEITHGTVTVKGKSNIYVCKTDVLFGFTKKLHNPVCYHNNIKMGGGVQYTAISQATADFFNNRGKENDIKIESDDYRGILTFAVSTYSNLSDLRGQTKDSVHNQFIEDSVYDLVFNRLNTEYGKGNQEVLNAVNKVIENASIRIQTRELAKLQREQKRAQKRAKPAKFNSCRAYDKKDASIAELWITEGDSADGSILNARDSNFQATLPIRGKALNVLKSSIDKIIKNKEITEIFNILETGMDLGIDDSFDISKLRFDKIVFATDADEDGYQIRVLLFLIFYRLAPQLITDGHIYIAEPPLFQIKLNDNSVKYAMTNEERDKLLKKYQGRVRGVNRFKGLGEMDAGILRETTVNPETRLHFTKLSMDMQDELSRDIIDCLFGADKFKQRKSVLVSILGEEVANMLEENALLFNEMEESDIDTGIEVVTIE